MTVVWLVILGAVLIGALLWLAKFILPPLGMRSRQKWIEENERTEG
jgi:hypothetical protein